MRIGIDFDNTLVSYDDLFYQVALERKLIPKSTRASKLCVRDHLRETGRESIWTELQGYVYGARMPEASAYSGAREFLSWARMHNHETYIVSHKTRYPFAGPRYDLHDAAREWVRSNLMQVDMPVLSPGHAFFELTKRDKLARIKALALDFFIDDLPEILEAEEFPTATIPLLFAPEGEHSLKAYIAFRTWDEIRVHIEERWTSLN
jgi:hypothetical protein